MIKFGIYLLVFMNSCILSFAQIGKKAQTNKVTFNFLEKSDYSFSKNNYGQHIVIKEPLPIGDVGERLDIGDDREIIGKLKFTKAMKIELLKEFLNFQGDTTKSNKYYFMKVKQPSNNYSTRWAIPEGKNFTIEIEALFSFTWILTKNTPPIQPVLIDRTTGKEINSDKAKVRIVYNIFKRWLKVNKRTGFKNFKLPLEGSPYRWLGDNVDLTPYLISTL